MATEVPAWIQTSPVRCASTVVPQNEHDVLPTLQPDIDIFSGQSGSGVQSGSVHDWWAKELCADAVSTAPAWSIDSSLVILTGETCISAGAADSISSVAVMAQNTVGVIRPGILKI
jgi:hypothetical protein